MATSRRIETELTLEESKSEIQKLHESNTALKLQLRELSKVKLGNFVEFSEAELEEVTDNFDKSCMIGEGGFARVYKGFLRHTNVAIKILNSKDSQGDIEFNQELEILTKVRHPNFVSLIGANRDARALVFEYVPNGSLDKFLNKGKGSPRKLSWKERIRIASEICSALIFLHSVPPHGIVHGDLKPENILLDSNLTTKLADFGISRKLEQTDNRSTIFHFTEVPKYTPAYCAPEFQQSFELTAKFDIYSFGVILLQFLTGRDPRAIWYSVEEALKKGKLAEVIDGSACWPTEEVEKLALLGLRCCHPVSSERPDSCKDVWPSIESLMRVASLHNQRNLFDEKFGLECQLSQLSRRLEELEIERDAAVQERDRALKNVEQSSCQANTFLKFDRSELEEATCNFDESLRIQQGEYDVYKGFLRHTVVAIKLFSGSQEDREFTREVEILRMVRHPNVISIIGACPEAQVTVYEFMPNGTLDTFISNRKNSHQKLSWQNRIRIASEICSALIFLHSVEPRGIVHGNLKPSSVLLDSDFKSKLTDFAVSCDLIDDFEVDIKYPGSQPQPYRDRESICSSELTAQSDIYSFGIILLQLVMDTDPRKIWMLAKRALQRGKLYEIVNGSAVKWPIEVAKKLISLGLRCGEPMSRERPDLARDVWPQIESVKQVAGLL